MREIVDLFLKLIMMVTCTIFLDLCYAKLNEVQLKFNKLNVLLIVITSIFTILNNMFIYSSIKAVLSLANVCIHFKFVFKDDNKKILISYIVIFLLLVIIEILITNLLSLCGILNSNQIASTVKILNLALSIFVQVVEYIIISFHHAKIFFQKIIKQFYRMRPLNVIYLIYISCFPLGMLNIINFTNKESALWLLLLMFFYLTFSLIILNSKFQELMLKKSNEKLTNYNDKYGKFLDEYKIYKHNINHKLSAMKAYGNKKINALIDDLLNEETDFSIKNNNLYNVPNGIKGIVAEKLYNSNLNVIIDNKIKKDPFKKLSPKAFHSLSESLGIVLDNAVEASEETDNPIVVMDLYEDKENIFIKVGNNFCNSIDIDQLGTKYYSTKKRESGLGLFSIMRNHLVKEKINIINDFYYIELEIKKAR